MQDAERRILLSVLLGVVAPAALLSLAVLLIPPLPSAPGLPEDSTPPSSETASAPERLRLTVCTEDGSGETMDLSDYLTGVLLAEMPADFEPEALKAQAVVSGTYALSQQARGGRHENGAVCTSPGCCQGYLSPESYLAAGGSRESVEKIRAAVEAAAGQVLTYDGVLIDATFFSCSGGSTEDAVAVWGRDVPYLQATPSPGEEEAAHYADTVTFPLSEFEAALGIRLTGSPDTWFSGTSYTSGGGVASVTIGGKTFTGVELRKHLGLRSTDMEFSAGAEEITVVTHGYGHRVGMSQYGAQAMAQAGSTYAEILAHYYQGATLEFWNH